MATEYVRECAHEKEGTQWVALCNPFKQCIRYDVINVKGRKGICSKKHARVLVVKEAKPRGENGALQKLNSSPKVSSKNIIESFFNVTGDDRAAV